jgi:predicted amidohydrolase YtcJ
MCDLILCNATVFTMDPGMPRAELVAIEGSKIAAVAGNEALGRLRERGTRIIDCGGRTVLPGFVDAHCHLFAYAESLASLDLSPREHIRSISDIQDKIRDLCKSRPSGAWVRGKACNEFYLAEKRLPNRWDLDAAAPFHPVKISHRSGHAHILSSIALMHAGISAETGDPPGGLIDRDPETGVPTGILYDMSPYLAEKIPPLDDAEMEQGLVLANRRLLSYGITSIQDASFINDLSQWRRFEDLKGRGILRPRLTMMRGWNGFAESQHESFFSRIGDADLRLGCVKIMAGQSTGSLVPSRDELSEQVSAINKAGLQAAVHAVEEPEIEAASDAIAHALKQHPRWDHRHRIEHCSVCPPPLLRRLAGLRVIVVTQPSFIYHSGDRYLETVPSGQLEHIYALGSMIRNGLAAAAGSDFPVSDPNPLAGVCAAVSRLTEGGRRVLPHQGIPLSDALRMHTLGAAAAGFEERIKGSISPGKVADLVVLDQDPFAIDPDAIKDIQVTATILGGRTAFVRDSGFGIRD